ncbi:hypothetical protein FQN53_002684 [Emmonsiellopsis sp. PD_33]|nr:hypothetical protein FQN53_002684 [Emmonsiellopsis sp. PD_33]
MAELTVGYVSGIIAAAIFLPLILAGLLRDENSLATWTQVGRALHSTYWPLILRGDSALTSAVSRAVKFEALLRPLALGIIAIAAVVTPLGLYEAIVPSKTTSLQPFQYKQDTSSFGFGTPPRSDLDFSRVCGFREYVACPGTDLVSTTLKNGTQILPYGIDSRIPSNVSDAFGSGLEDLDPTVSSIFDIEWRNYGIDFSERINNGSRYLIGKYRQASILALNNAYDIIEGLIVDTKNGGGIGFRNHTIPSPLPHGSEWSEDLLFVEPHTQCVDTNLTLDFRISLDGGITTEKLVLTDRGGFVNLNTTYPYYDLNDTQSNPDLIGRAYKAAYLNNAQTMMYLNVSNPNAGNLSAWSYLNSKMNKTFTLEGNMAVNYDRLVTTSKWGSYLLTPHALSNMTSNKTTAGDDYPNPWNISSSNFSSISRSFPGYSVVMQWNKANSVIATICQGAGGLDLANITNIGVACGMVLGAARRGDGSRSLIYEPGTEWTIPLYSCASTSRAVIKTVDFRYNGTDGLKSLAILNIHDKEYQKEEDKPLWGVEHSELMLDDVKPIWGLVSSKYEGRSDISVLRKESLYLPGYLGVADLGPTSYYNLPGSSFHMGGFSTAYDISDAMMPSGVSDYSGETNIAMYAKWQELSATANSTARIIDLVWTDVAANSVVGTKSWLGPRKHNDLAKRDDHGGSPRPKEGDLVEVPVIVFNRRVKYHLKFAIPAFVALLLTTIVAAVSCVLCIFGRARPSRVRKYLFHTAPGRIIATYAYPGQVSQQAPSKMWDRAVGSKRIAVGDLAPRSLDTLKMGNDVNTNIDAPLLHKEQSEGERLPPPNPGFTSPTPQQYRPYSP